MYKNKTEFYCYTQWCYVFIEISLGWAWVTATEQALWTDGRYFTQAEQQLDCNWILMKEGGFALLTS